MLTSDHKRFYSLVVILLPIVFVGLPIWWVSTSVVRSPLPYEVIQQMSQLQFRGPPITTHIVLSELESASFAQQFGIINEENQKSSLNSVFISVSRYPDNRFRSVKSFFDETQPVINRDVFQRMDDYYHQFANEIADSPNQYVIFILRVDEKDNTATWPLLVFGKYRHAFLLKPNTLTEDRVIQSVLRGISVFSGTSPEYAFTEEDKRTSLSLTSGGNPTKIRISMILLNGISYSNNDEEDNSNIKHKDEQNVIISKWNINEIISNTFHKFAEIVSPVYSIEIDSQIYYHISPLIKPHYQAKAKNNEESYYYYNDYELTSVLSHPSEWNNHYFGNENERLTFLVFIPPKTNTPLRIKTTNSSSGASHKNTNSFLIPRTGGISFFNLNYSNGNVSDTIDVSDLTNIWISHLRKLIGIRKRKINDISNGKNDDVYFLNSKYGINQYEIDDLSRRIFIEKTHHSIKTMNSLLEMINQITVLPVLKNIKELVDESISSLAKVNSLITEENNFYLALKEAMNAADCAKKAFFDDKMVGLLYFPNDHKFAVYVSLYLPVFLTLASKLVKEFKRIRGKSTDKVKTA